MKIVWILVVILFPSLLTLAQPDEGFRNYYVGTVGDSVKIQMDLTIYTDYAEGTYYSEGSANGDIRLEGGPSSNGNMVLREDDPQDSASTGASFSGTLSPFSETFEGTWHSSDGKTARAFKLIKTAEYLRDSFGDGFDRARSYYPHFLSTRSSWQNLNLALDDENSGYIERFITGKLYSPYFTRASSSPGREYFTDYTIRYYSDDFASLLVSTRQTQAEGKETEDYRSRNILFTNGAYREVRLSELFTPGADYTGILSDYILNDLRNQEASQVADSSISRLGRSDLNIVSITPRFLEFTFMPGSVGAFEEGTYVVRVPYDALEGYLNRDGFLKRFLSAR